MKIEYMNQDSQVMIQEAKIVNQNYLISWLALTHYQDVLVCLKSSLKSYDSFVEELRRNDADNYSGGDIFWQKANKQTSINILTSAINPPIDVIILATRNDTVYIPNDGNKKTIKGIIKATKNRKTKLSYFCNAKESILFSSNCIIPEREVIAEYRVRGHIYPVTKDMFGKQINVQVPKNDSCNLCIAGDMNNKYNLIIDKE